MQKLAFVTKLIYFKCLEGPPARTPYSVHVATVKPPLIDEFVGGFFMYLSYVPPSDFVLNTCSNKHER